MNTALNKATWQLQHAKNSLSVVVERALTEGPQEITRHGKSVVFIVSREEFIKRSNRQPTKPTLLGALRSCSEPLIVDQVKDKPRGLKL